MQKPLLPILTSWKIRTGGEGLLFRPTCTTRGGTEERPPTFMRQHTLRRHLSVALASCSLPFLTWYQATRHTFASQWVLSGGSLEKLARVMGYNSVVVTERYAHLRTDLFRAEDYELLKAPGAGGPKKSGNRYSWLRGGYRDLLRSGLWCGRGLKVRSARLAQLDRALASGFDRER